LRGNGKSVLQDLVHVYKPKNIPEVIAAKTTEFWGTLKCAPNESVDAYYNRFQELLDDLAEADEPISTKSAVRHILFTLGPEFQSFQNNFRINNLPDAWKTQDWPSFLVLCRDYYNSVKPTGVERLSSPESTFHKEAHQKKTREWFLNPTKFYQQIENEQRHHLNKCIYHLSKTHQTSNCAVKKECNKILEAKKSSDSVTPATSTRTGQLRHLTEEEFSDAVTDDVTLDADCVTKGNDTNEAALMYFSRISKDYLRLVKSSSSHVSPSRHDMLFPVIADSGANYHMFNDRSFFQTLAPATGNVLLGDGKTSLSIKGVGTVYCRIGSQVLTIPKVKSGMDCLSSFPSFVPRQLLVMMTSI
jgi:hypothetical protein